MEGSYGRIPIPLLFITQDWISIIESGREVVAIFFNFQEAFDNVPHLKKLENINFNGYILQWIINYLTNHSKHVVVNGATSQPSPVISGVPQGSVLGPLLYINNLFEVELSILEQSFIFTLMTICKLN